MAGSASRQDEANPVFRLATRAGKMGLSCPLGLPALVPQKRNSVGVFFSRGRTRYIKKVGMLVENFENEP